MKGHILVVEDDQIIQFDLCRQLLQLGYAVAGVASSGEEAVAKATRLTPDLVLMDIRLKGEMSGFEAAREIRSSRVIPVIYLTAQSADSHAWNVDDLRITKPFKEGLLQAAIEKALESK